MTKAKEIVLSVVPILFYTIVYVAYSEVEPPPWFIETPNDDYYYYGVGYSTKGMEDAEAKARKELILGIEATIQVAVTSDSHSVDDGNSEKSKEEFRTSE